VSAIHPFLRASLTSSLIPLSLMPIKNVSQGLEKNRSQFFHELMGFLDEERPRALK
jgi:hypothetical protein